MQEDSWTRVLELFCVVINLWTEKRKVLYFPTITEITLTYFLTPGKRTGSQSQSLNKHLVIIYLRLHWMQGTNIVHFYFYFNRYINCYWFELQPSTSKEVPCCFHAGNYFLLQNLQQANENLLHIHFVNQTKFEIFITSAKCKTQNVKILFQN